VQAEVAHVRQLDERVEALRGDGDRAVKAAVDEDTIADAMVLLMERAKLYVEGAGAVGVAALLGGQVRAAESGTTIAVLSGGNVDPGLLAAVARRAESEAGRRLVLLTRVADRPGGLAHLLVCVADTGANIVDVSHVREGLDLHVRETAIELVIETRGQDHAEGVVSMLRDAGYETRVIR
jgi:threonine dehydratase